MASENSLHNSIQLDREILIYFIMTCSEKEEDMTQDLPDPAPIPVVSRAFLSCYLNNIPNLFIPCIVYILDLVLCCTVY